jgi:SAM-dependent methyltransferase
VKLLFNALSEERCRAAIEIEGDADLAGRFCAPICHCLTASHLKCKVPMNTTHDTASEQTALWNGAAGRAWVEAQQLLDRLFTPFEDLLVAAVRAASARSVLDVGCGTGSTTIAVARALGSPGRCLGVDISEPMITLARARAARERVPAEFVLADAQVHTFEARAWT